MPPNSFQEIVARAISLATVIENPSFEELGSLAKKDARVTAYGSISFISQIKSRSAKFTEVLENGPDKAHLELLGRVLETIKGRTLLAIDRSVGQDPKAIHCRAYVPIEYAKQALIWASTLFPVSDQGEPEMRLLFVSDWSERHIFVDPVSSITIGLGSDYAGELKMAALRMVMYDAKKKGGLGLHAGSKCLYVRNAKGQLLKKGILLFGLSGTGKTTLTCHHHWLNAAEDERIVILQDDITLLWPDGSCTGTEDNFYIKTEGLTSESEPLLYRSVIRPDVIFENVCIREDGKVDLLNYDLTSNGRAVIIREKLEQTDNSIDLKRTDMAIFITRRKTIVPPIAKLSPEQAAAFFMLGESVETSAGDPLNAGKPVHVVGANPFIIGSAAEEGNRFYELIKKNNIECYLLNTGKFGLSDNNEGEKITVKHSSICIAEAARGSIEWIKDTAWGYLVPKDVRGLDMAVFDWKKHYSPDKYAELTDTLRQERVAWLSKFPGLKKEIKNAIAQP